MRPRAASGRRRGCRTSLDTSAGGQAPSDARAERLSRAPSCPTCRSKMPDRSRPSPHSRAASPLRDHRRNIGRRNGDDALETARRSGNGSAVAIAAASLSSRSAASSVARQLIRQRQRDESAGDRREKHQRRMARIAEPDRNAVAALSNPLRQARSQAANGVLDLGERPCFQRAVADFARRRRGAPFFAASRARAGRPHIRPC